MATDGLSAFSATYCEKISTASDVTVATKAGRRLDPHTTEGYTEANLRQFVDRSRENLGVDALDLFGSSTARRPTSIIGLQSSMHSTPSATKGWIERYGVSVERVEEGLKAITYPGVESVQIIFNPFRQRPAELFFEEAEARDVGVIVRVPLARDYSLVRSRETEFPDNDHRNYNREGKAFDVGGRSLVCPTRSVSMLSTR